MIFYLKMDETIKYSVAGIILALMLYILEVRLNGVYTEGRTRDKELSLLKQRNEDLGIAMLELAKEIKGLKNIPSGKCKL